MVCYSPDVCLEMQTGLESALQQVLINRHSKRKLGPVVGVWRFRSRVELDRQLQSMGFHHIFCTFYNLADSDIWQVLEVISSSKSI